MTRTAFYADYVWYNNKIHTNTHLLVDGDTIAGIAEHPSDDFKIEKFANSAIFPGLVNTHTHLPMGLFRGMADDLPLMEWLQKHIWPAEGKWLSPEFIQAATDLAAVEMIKSGTTLSNDMYFLSDFIAESIRKSGLKGVVGVGVLDFPTKFGNNADDYITNASKLYEKYKGDELISVSLCPHAPYTVNPENYTKCVEFCAKHGLVLHTHLMEADHESADSVAKYGKTTVQIMNEVGAFDIKSIFAHCVQLNDEEIALMGEKKVSVAHCIQSNMKLANGFAPVKKMMDAGINVTIGTDGAASNNDLDMIDETRSVALVHKGVLKDATALSADTVLHMATSCGAKALAVDNTGELKKGNKADFIAVSFDSPKTTPVFNPVSHLVYSASASDVTAMYVNGKCLMKDRVILTVDEEKIKYNARAWAEKIKKG